MRKKINDKNYVYDESARQLTFLDTRFYHHTDGSYLPSVTTILEAYPKGAQFYEWLKSNGQDSDDIRDQAGRSGSVVHQLTEDYDYGHEVTLMDDNGAIHYKLNEWAMFERYVDFRTRYDVNIKEIELNCISSKLGFAGTLDRVAKINGKTILFDIKTSSSIYPSYWLQLAAYLNLYAHKTLKGGYMTCGIDEVGILWLNAKTRTEGKKGAVQGIGWQLVTKPVNEVDEDWELFKAVHKVWKAEFGNMKPRELSYKISHAYTKNINADGVTVLD